jgi:putative ABC transport system ATP-binding protein
MIILKATSLKKIYNGNQHSLTTALDYVDLELEEGSFTTIMGPSGSGKTTLLSILSGMSTPTVGEVKILDQILQHMSKEELALFRRRYLGFIYQDYNLLDGLTIKENIMLPLILEKGNVSSMQEKAQALMKLFAIEDISEKHPHNVSGGQQQRCAIARALMNNSSMIFADEPTGNLDSKSAKTVMRAFERANTENNSTILMVTHDPYTASYSRRVIFIKDGRIETELYRKDNQKEFFHQIMDYLTVLEGENCAF